MSAPARVKPEEAVTATRATTGLQAFAIGTRSDEGKVEKKRSKEKGAKII
jgi:hypothetical protein